MKGPIMDNQRKLDFTSKVFNIGSDTHKQNWVVSMRQEFAVFDSIPPFLSHIAAAMMCLPNMTAMIIFKPNTSIAPKACLPGAIPRQAFLLF
jgi:hypothetical protein